MAALMVPQDDDEDDDRIKKTPAAKARSKKAGRNSVRSRDKRNDADAQEPFRGSPSGENSDSRRGRGRGRGGRTTGVRRGRGRSYRGFNDDDDYDDDDDNEDGAEDSLTSQALERLRKATAQHEACVEDDDAKSGDPQLPLGMLPHFKNVNAKGQR